jgi:diacylglycerol kinase family enzyme
VRVLVVVNPRATATSQRVRDLLVKAIKGSADVTVEKTENRGHAAALACRAMRSHVDAVIAVGGDGTVNEVVNGLLTDGVHRDTPPLGIIPVGSTNVVARALGIANDPIEATGNLLDALNNNSTRHISLGKMDDRWFVFAAGVGIDAAVVESVERERRRGKRSTHSLYVRLAIKEFYSAERKNPQLSVEFADGMQVDGLYNAIVTNTDPWTFVGKRPVRPTPTTTFDTGLGFYGRRNLSTIGTLLGVANMLRPSKTIPQWGSFVREDVSALTIRCESPQPVQVDGDLLEPRSHMRIWSVPRAISVIV